MQQRSSPGTVYRARTRPTAAFGYQPAIDLYDELAKAGEAGMSVEALGEAMRQKGWKRPRGGELTTEITRIDLVSMCKNQFVERIDG